MFCYFSRHACMTLNQCVLAWHFELAILHVCVRTCMYVNVRLLIMCLYVHVRDLLLLYKNLYSIHVS